MRKKVKFMVTALFAAVMIVGVVPAVTRPTTVQAAIKVKSISFPQKTKTMYVHNVWGNMVDIYPSNATERALSFKSSNPSVATVKGIAGCITAKKAGTAIITARTTDGSNKTASIKIIVKNLKISSIKFDASSKTLRVGRKFTMTRTISPSNATNTKLSYKSSNPSVASVDSNGKVTAKKVGTAVITGTATDGSKKSAKYTVKVVSKIDISKVTKYNVRTLAPKASEAVKSAFEIVGCHIIKGDYTDNSGIKGYFNGIDRLIYLKNPSVGDTTVYHELGHFVAFVSGNMDSSYKFTSVYNAENKKGSVYGRTSQEEYFAESYRDYILNKSTLKKNRPKTYAYIENALKKVTKSRAESYKKMLDDYDKKYS